MAEYLVLTNFTADKMVDYKKGQIYSGNEVEMLLKLNYIEPIKQEVVEEPKKIEEPIKEIPIKEEKKTFKKKKWF